MLFGAALAGYSLILLLVHSTEAQLPPSGHVAAWLYDTKGGASAEWSAAVAGFNHEAIHPINGAWVVVGRGGFLLTCAWHCC